MNYFDLHCDTPYECFKENKSFLNNDLSISAEKGKKFENWHQVFAVWIKDTAENPLETYRYILNDFKNKLKQELPPNLTPYYAVEGGAVLEGDTERLYVLKEDNIKFLTLTWNGENNIAGGTYSQKRLTDFGKQVIQKMNNLGMICDLSHLNRKSFFDVCEKADKIVATHSNCDTICCHKRNLTDSQIKIIAEKKGVMGICFYPDFLGGEVFQKIYENIYYLCDKGYEDIISIGTDFDGGKMARSLNNISQITDLYSFLEKKGLSKELLNKVFYQNAYNFIAKS